ncbi:High mobility group protein B3 [Smittium mucronatum]|uniref:High mobility group protein B3 n=1 Tax=Smittium mucronatum TaxID=133383 RepID=A0A1R0GRQ0_9FUNG|nr:High mobility group protein B3 [Smittium mucronatum]
MAPKAKAGAASAGVFLSAEEFSAIGEHFAKLAELFDNASKNIHPAAESTSKRAAKDPFAPKRPVSSYILFCNDYREKIKLLEPSISSQEVSKRMGDLWNNISEAEKAKYDEMALELRVKYTEDMQNYRALKTAVESLEGEEVLEVITETGPANHIPGFQKIAPNAEKIPISPPVAKPSPAKKTKAKASTPSEKPLKKKKVEEPAPTTPAKNPAASESEADPTSSKKKKRAKKDPKK